MRRAVCETNGFGNGNGRVKHNLAALLLWALAVLAPDGRSEAMEGIYWTVIDGVVSQSALDGSGVAELARTEGALLTGFAISDDYLFWCTDRGVWRSAPDGSGATLIVRDAILPINIAVFGNFIYWTEFDGAIRRALLDGSSAKDFITAVNEPSGIAVTATHIYWSETAIGRQRLRRANLDGSEIVTLVSGLSIPDHVAVHGDSLYWSDLGARKIQRSDLDGTGVVNFVLNVGSEGIAVTDTHLYWADWEAKRIGRVGIDGSGITRNLIPLQSTPYGIAVIDRGSPRPPLELVAESVTWNGGELEIEFRVEGELPPGGMFTLRRNPAPQKGSWVELPAAAWSLTTIDAARRYRITVPNPQAKADIFDVGWSAGM